MKRHIYSQSLGLNLGLLFITLGWGLFAVQAGWTKPKVIAQVSATPTPSLSPSPSFIEGDIARATTVATESIAKLMETMTATPTSVPSAVAKATPTPRTRVQAAVPVSTPTPVAVTPTPVPATPTPTSTPDLGQVIRYKISAPDIWLEGEIDAAGKTVAEVTQAIAQSRGVSFKYNTTPMGWFVTEIAGVKENPTKSQHWIYYVNGFFGDTAVNQKRLSAGDKLEWYFSR